MAVQYNTQQQIIYYHTSTTNKSFLEMSQYLKDTGIKNYRWPLILIDPDLAAIDPFDPRLPQHLKMKVLKECINNPIYFIRECVRLESTTPGGMKFELNRGNMAIIFCMLMNINIFVDLPRQTGKTIAVVTVLLHWYQFGITNAEFNFLHKRLDGATDNLERLRKMRDLLPSYLKMNQSFDVRNGNKLKEKSNVQSMQHPINNNRIRTLASARNKTAAASLMRGRTSPIIYYDEFAFSPYNNIVYTNMVPAFNTAATNCKRVNAPYGIFITTTPGLLTTDEGTNANNFKNAATPFDENWYNLTKRELDDLIGANSNSNFVYIRYTYQQLGKSEQWFRDICRDMQDWTAIRREVLLEWSNVNDKCPFAKEDLDTIRCMLRQPASTVLIFNKYLFKIYDKMMSRSVPILGCDVAAGLNRDASTITIIDSETSKVTATFECNYISTIEFAAVIQYIVENFMPNAVINIERNGGFGTSVIAKLVKSRIKNNLFYTIKERVIEERIMGAQVYKHKQKVKVYGFDSSKNGRDELMELISDRVEYHKDKIIDARIYEELCALEVTPRGRIDHPNNGHDDLVIALALALYVLYRGGDIANNFGITRRNIRTDADIDEEINEVSDNDEIISDRLDMVEPEEVQQQLETLKNAPGKMLYEEWMQSEFAKDQEAMDNILRTKDGREAYMRQFHIAADSIEKPMTSLPASVFTDFYADESAMNQSNGAGNLYSSYMKVMSNK